MRRRFQAGGPTTPATPPDVSEAGALDPNMLMLMMMSESMARTTTPEAKAQAQAILDKFMANDQQAWDKMLQGHRDQAAEVRAALQTARERLNAQKFGRSEALLAIGRGLGAPTRSGAIGETASNVAGELSPVVQRKREWQEGMDDALSKLDLAEATTDQGVINAEFELNKLREEAFGRVAVEAMDTLGRSTTGLSSLLGRIVPASVQARDADYVRNYHNPFTTGGAERAAAGLDRLRFVADVLRRGSDALTGPYIGAVRSIPVIGDMIRSMVVPNSVDLQGIVERTIQEDLRPTLGSQFTQQEGENLINRTYNTSLEEPRNARRLDQLIAQMEAALQNRVQMAQYYDTYQTLYGFKNQKLDYKAGDFQFEDGPGQQPVEFRDMPPGPEKDLALQIWIEQHPGEQVPQWMLDSMEGRARGGPVRYKKGGRVKFQEGGFAFNPPADPNAIQFNPPEGDQYGDSLLGDLERRWDEMDDPVGTAMGAFLGFGGNAMVDSLLERRMVGAERRVADALSNAGYDPTRVANDIARNQRQGHVPETLMDVDAAGVRSLSREAMKFGDAPAEAALRELRLRLESSRDRVNERVNSGLKPYEYFEHDNKLVRQLEGPRAAEMRAAFKNYKAVPIDSRLQEIITTPVGSEAVEWAWKFYDNAPGRRGPKVDKEGMIQNPSLEFLDYVRKGFNQIIATEESKGDTEYGGVLRDLREMYLKRLGQVAPEYQAALDAQGDDLAIRDALHRGRTFMKKQPEELEEYARSLSFHQRNAFRTGMAQHIYEVLDKNTGEQFNAAQRIVGSPAMLARLRPFFDSQHEFDVFQTALERESELMRIGKERLSDGSAARMEREKSRQTWSEYAAQRLPGMRFAISLPGWTLRLMRDMPKMTPKEAEAVIRVLRQGSPEQMRNFASKVQTMRRLRSTRNLRRAAGAGIGAAAGAVFGGDNIEE